MLARNDVFQFVATDGACGRLLAANTATDEAWVISIEDPKTGLPRRFVLSDLIAKEERGEITRVEQTNIAPIVMQISVASRERRDKAWTRIAPLVSNPSIFLSSERKKLVAARAVEVGCSIVTLYKDLRRYWIGGQTKDSLIPGFYNCGSKVKEITIGRGRPVQHGNYTTYQLQAIDIKHIKSAITRHYLSGEVHTIESTYQRLLEEHYTYLDGNGDGYIKPLGERPTYRQFQHFVNTQFSEEIIIRRRKGDKAFEQNHRARLSSALNDCIGVGHIYEIDATIADYYLVSSRSSNFIIGKPTLYLIYDRRSRLCVGWYIGLEAPSWPAAMHAILSIAEDKAEMCRRHGVPYSESDWPAHGIFPQTFIGDLGEMISLNSNLLVEGLQISMANTPSMRPDYKGTVECGFKMLQCAMAASTPGYEPPDNVTKRRGKHYEHDACLTLDMFKSLMLKNIITHNKKVMKGYPTSVEMLTSNVQPIPIDIWTHEYQRRMGVLTRFDAAFVRFSLLPHAQATVTRDGILFNDCYYTCPEALELGWFVSAGRKTFKKNISYDRRLVDSIFIHSTSDPTKYYVATLLEKSKEYAGLSFSEVQVYTKLRSLMSRGAEQHNRQMQSEYHAHAKPITSEAMKEMRRSSKGKSRSARKADIVTDRLHERQSQRQIEAAMPEENKTINSVKNNVVELHPLHQPINQQNTQSDQNQESNPKTLEERLRLKRKELLNEY